MKKANVVAENPSMSDFAINITEAAAARVRMIQKKRNKPDGVFKIDVKSGGCSGFQYVFNLEDSADVTIQADCYNTEQHGITVIIPEYAKPFLDKSTVDFKTSLSGSAFSVENPNAVSGCGCGSSFAI
jgi:iron-sulfur cluster assembly accessory protein